MEDERLPTSIDDGDLIRRIQATYLGTSNQAIRQAETYLSNVARQPNLIDKLMLFVSPSANFDSKFKLSAAIVLKKAMYSTAESEREKGPYMRELYGLLRMAEVPHKVKSQLGICLEYMLNKDEDNKYKPEFLNRLLSDQADETDIDALHGLMFMNIAGLNSLVEIEEITMFFMRLVPMVGKASIYLLEQLALGRSKPEENTKRMALILNSMNVLFEFIEISIERIFDEQELIRPQIASIIGDMTLVAIFQAYLLFDRNEESLISRNSQPMNKIKASIMQSIFHMYQPHCVPEPLFNVLYLTFIFESVNLNKDRDHHQEKIVCRCLQLLEKQLEERHYYNYFIQHKIQFLFTLLLYSATSKFEEEDMEGNPEKFSEVSEEYSETYSSSCIIKVRAACFIKVMMATIDDVPRNLVEICVILISSSMPTQTVSNDTMKDVKSAFDQFPFSSLPARSKLETVFMVLTVMSPVLHKREELANIVYAVLSVNLENFAKLSEPLVLARIMRLLGYYPSPPYYSFIKLRMGTNQVCLLEGFRSFERILREKQYPEIYELLAEIFYELLDCIKLTDSIAQALILNNYEKVISKSEKLFRKTVGKLISVFNENAQHNSHHATLALNFISSLLVKETDQERRALIEREVGTILQICTEYPKYDETVIDIYLTLLKGSTVVEEQVYAYAESKISKIETFGNNSSIFKFYNQLFMRMSSVQSKVEFFYANLLSKLSENCQGKSKTQPTIVPHISLLLGQLIFTSQSLSISQENLLILFRLAQHDQQNRSSILSIVLAFMYVQPVRIRTILVSKGLYEQALGLLTAERFQGKLHRKIFVLGMVRLLEIEEKYFKQIMLVCVKYLKIQTNSYRIKKREKKPRDPKLRKVLTLDSEEEHIQEEDYHNDYWDNFFRNFKHPADSLSQFDMFKVRMWQNMHIAEDLTESEKEDLRELIETDWWHHKARRVYKVKRKPNPNGFMLDFRL